MTGMELIVAALAAAATAGTTSAVQDAYSGLKELLTRRLSGREQAVRQLDGRATDPGVWQTRLGADLQAAGADTDERILAAARAVLAQTDPTGTRAGAYNVATNHGAVGQFYAPVTFQQGSSIPPA